MYTYTKPANKIYEFNNISYNSKGIYLMSFGNETYVGSTKCFQSRWTTWIGQLTNDIDIGFKVRNAFAKYMNKCSIDKDLYKLEVYEALKFTVLEEVEDDSNLLTLEQEWIDRLEPSLNSFSAIYQYQYQPVPPEIKSYNIKKAAEYRASIIIKRQQEIVFKPLVDKLLKIDTSNYKRGKWKITYKDKVWRFPVLSKFCDAHGLSFNLLNKIKEGGSITPPPFSIVNTKPNRRPTLSNN